jgi:hypothetical protein
MSLGRRTRRTHALVSVPVSHAQRTDAGSWNSESAAAGLVGVKPFDFIRIKAAGARQSGRSAAIVSITRPLRRW